MNWFMTLRIFWLSYICSVFQNFPDRKKTCSAVRSAGGEDDPLSKSKAWQGSQLSLSYILSQIFSSLKKISFWFEDQSAHSKSVIFLSREEAWALYLAKLEEEANYFTVPETEQVPSTALHTYTNFVANQSGNAWMCVAIIKIINM